MYKQDLKEQRGFGLMKDESGGKIMTEFIGLRAETYSYLIYDGSDNKKEKDTKRSITKKKT